MALIKKTNNLDKIEIVGQFKHIQIRSSEWVEDDETGEVFGSPKYSRRTINPVDDVSGESVEVQAIANAMFTQQIKDLYSSHIANQIKE